MLPGRLQVIAVVAEREQAGVQLGVKRLDPPVHDFGKAGQLGDLPDGDPRLRELAGGAAGRDDLDPQVGQATGELDDAGLVGDRQQRAGDLYLARGDRRLARHCLGALLHPGRL